MHAQVRRNVKPARVMRALDATRRRGVGLGASVNAVAATTVGPFEAFAGHRTRRGAAAFSGAVRRVLLHASGLDRRRHQTAALPASGSHWAKSTVRRLDPGVVETSDDDPGGVRVRLHRVEHRGDREHLVVVPLDALRPVPGGVGNDLRALRRDGACRVEHLAGHRVRRVGIDEEYLHCTNYCSFRRPECVRRGVPTPSPRPCARRTSRRLAPRRRTPSAVRTG